MRIAVWKGASSKDTVRNKVADAIRRLELHKKQLETVRSRIQDRSSDMFEHIVFCIQSEEKDKATVYANEYAELKKIIKVLMTAELAFTQIILRLESIRDVGDAMKEMQQAFGVIKGVGKVINGLSGQINSVQTSIQNTLSDTMAELGQVAPDLSINVQTSNGEEIVEEAIKYVKSKFEGVELPQPPTYLPSSVDKEILATPDGEDDEFKIDVMTPQKLEDAVSDYITKSGKLNVYETAAAIGQPVDSVENTVIKLVSEGRLHLPRKSDQN
ncbi:MAG: hypothetical protein QXT39_04330 [Conexivisphaerales archaeon]